jgi:hypothetical protein
VGVVSIFMVLFAQSKQTNTVNGFVVSIIAIISIIVSGINLIIMGYIADELGLGGDVVSSYMFLIILGLNILNSFIYFKNKKIKNY